MRANSLFKLLLLGSVAFLASKTTAKSLFDNFCGKNLGNYDKKFQDFPIEVGYMYACCGQITVDMQDACFRSEEAIVPFVLFNLELLLESIENSRVAPTVKESAKFSADALARKLHKAIDGWGTDEKTIINVLSSIDSLQRKHVGFSYKKLYGKYLRSALRDDTSGCFQDLLLAIMLLPEEHDAWLVRDAIADTVTDYDILVDVIATSTVSEILHVREAYQRLYNDDSMEDDLEKELKGQGPVKELVIHFCTRYSNTITHDFITTTLSAYQSSSGDEQERVSWFAHVIYESAIFGRSRYFAARISSAMAGFGTQDSKLIGLVTSRLERDMAAVKEHYLTQEGRSLQSDVKSDLSGDYLSLMLKLI